MIEAACVFVGLAVGIIFGLLLGLILGFGSCFFIRWAIDKEVRESWGDDVFAPGDGPGNEGESEEWKRK